MWIVYAGVLGSCLCLLLLSRKEDTRVQDVPAYLKLFIKPAYYLYRKAGMPVSGKVSKQISLLYASGLRERLTGYYVQKTALFILAVTGAAAMCLLLGVSQYMGGELSDGMRLQRDGYGTGSREVMLEATIRDRKEQMNVAVGRQKYSSQQLQNLLEELLVLLETQITGGNLSVDQITESLVLPASVKGFPFQITWESSNLELIRSDGEVYSRNADEEGSTVVLTAAISCQNQRWEHQFAVRVCRPVLTGEEQLKEELLKQIDRNDREAETEESFQLPGEIHGEPVLWKEKKQDSTGIFLTLLVVSVLLFFLKNRELQKSLVQKDQELLLSYPDFISRLVLLLGAGLSVRNAILRMASDYLSRKKRTGITSAVYEELLLVCHEMESGCMEAQAYEHFGHRCRLPQYRKCMALLEQNLRKGSSGLVKVLQEEAANAFEERKRIAREQGEKAGTKLLIPMMMMLAVVMVLIMVPACFSFAGM